MLSTSQIELVSGIVSQYDYYLVYYDYDYSYTSGTDRNYLIKIYCSDQQPVYDNGTYNFTDCIYYELTYNLYLTQSEREYVSFAPRSEDDLVYTNVVEGMPQLVYEVSEFHNYDWGRLIVACLCVVFAVACIFRVLFGGFNK